jgi:tetratricopeptide (TPR) repeat protein
MKLKERVHCSGKIPAGVLLLALVAGMIPVVPLSAFQADASASLGKLKSMAEAQHEIVILLIKKQEYDQAAAEGNKIFDMKWPGDQEPLLLKELLNLADAFLQQGQAPSGLRLIERNSKYFRKTSSQASIFKEMGYLYKSLKQDDKAIEYFKKARNLEGSK